MSASIVFRIAAKASSSFSFRLDISRLHADWLLKTKDYPTALEFDQLRKTLKDKDSPFPGFQEGPILFAPTCSCFQRARY